MGDFSKNGCPVSLGSSPGLATIIFVSGGLGLHFFYHFDCEMTYIPNFL